MKVVKFTKKEFTKRFGNFQGYCIRNPKEQTIYLPHGCSTGVRLHETYHACYSPEYTGRREGKGIRGKWRTCASPDEAVLEELRAEQGRAKAKS